MTVIPPKSSLCVDREKYQQKRVAAYCRVSTDSEEQLTSYNTQKKVYTEMILAKKEWCLAGIYADEGISGTQAKKRDEFNRMIKDCLDGKIDYIITKSVSRFARNTVECLDYVRMLKARNIGIIFEEQNIDTLKTDSELYLVIYAGFAQSESESISKNVTWAVRKNFEEGKVQYNYGRWFGYRKGEDGQPEIVPEEAAVIRNIFSMYLAGKTTMEIAESLRNNGVKTKCGTDNWKPATVLYILKNVKYCGDAILQKTVTVDCITKTQKKNEGEAPMYYVRDAHAAIISRDYFNKTQEEMVRRKSLPPLNSNTVTAQGRYSRYALTGIIQCAECGSVYRRCSWNIRGKRKIVWRCSSRLDNGKKYCHNSPTVAEEDLHRAIVRAINKFSSENSSTYKKLMKVSLSEALGLYDCKEEVDLLTRRIDGLNQKMMELISQTMLSGKSVSDNEDEFRDISNEIEQLKQRIETIQNTANKSSVSRARKTEIDNRIDNFADTVNEYDDTLVRQMIECIRVYDNRKIEVIFCGDITVEENIACS